MTYLYQAEALVFFLVTIVAPVLSACVLADFTLGTCIVNSMYMYTVHKTSKIHVHVSARSAIADSCFGLIGAGQCSVAQEQPATSTVYPYLFE